MWMFHILRSCNGNKFGYFPIVNSLDEEKASQKHEIVVFVFDLEKKKDSCLPSL